MKALLIIFLFVFSLCEEKLGGYKRRSFQENDLNINQAFKDAADHYMEANNVDDINDLIRLTVYSELVNGNNYKVTFIDSTADFPAIQEYVINVPFSNTKNEGNKIVEIKEYLPNEGLIPFNEARFTLLEIELHKFLKDTNEKLNFISYLYPVKNEETNFYVINAYTEDGEHDYIVCQDLESNEYYTFEKIK